MRRARRRGWRTRPRKLLAGLAVAAAVVLLAELGLRGIEALTGGPPPYDPLPEPPALTVLCPVEGRPERVRTCPDAGRSFEQVWPVEVDRVPSRSRVVAIGESYVYGLGLEAASPSAGAGWPAALERVLGDVEVVNLGRCGSYATRLVAHVQAAVELRADLVIVAVGNNEHTMTSFFTGLEARHPLRAWERRERWVGGVALLRRLALVTRGALQVTERPDPPPWVLLDPVATRIYAGRRRPPDLSAFPQGVADRVVTEALEEEQRLKERMYRRRLEEMVAVARAGGVPILFTTLPALPRPPTLSGTWREPTEAVLARLRALEEAGPGPHERLAHEAAATDPQVAVYQHHLALALERTGDVAGALAAQDAVRSWELTPDGTPELRAELLEAASVTAAPLVDVEAAVARRTDRAALFLDSVHLSQTGADAVASLLVEPVRAIVPPGPAAPGD